MGVFLSKGGGTYNKTNNGQLHTVWIVQQNETLDGHFIRVHEISTTFDISVYLFMVGQYSAS